MQDASFEGALETLLMTVLPLLVDNAESTVLVWWTSMNPAGAPEMLMAFVCVQDHCYKAPANTDDLLADCCQSNAAGWQQS